MRPVMKVREMRLLARDLKGEERDKGLGEALKEVGAILKTDWGKGHLDAIKERIMVLEDWDATPARSAAAPP